MVQIGGIQIFPSDFSVAALDVHSGICPTSLIPPQIYTVAITNRKYWLVGNFFDILLKFVSTGWPK